ncbi:MAG: hypothetical protein NC310_04720 [Roseburia sp.]|nr:hypothetical protein [Anaeroplasma bactoclasticum]MCM1196363.1 hypothetical protein [Roseburia sp.]MCM1557754.1 hypothetical protein [Anaeroplasma bactoclasticum]
MIDFDLLLAEEKTKENEKNLAIFQRKLEEEGLSKKTIERHLDNVDLYINVY